MDVHLIVLQIIIHHEIGEETGLYIQLAVHVRLTLTHQFRKSPDRRRTEFRMPT